MAESSSQHLPIRAISLPSRYHPVCAKFEAILNHLKTWQIMSSSASETAPFGAESIQIGLVGVAELYTCVDEILGTPHAQRAILWYQSGKLVEEALDASVTLLDTCSILKETLLTMKENVLSLQSALRRKGTNYSSMESNVSAYVNSRKKAQKDIEMCFQRLKKLERRVSCSTTLSDSSDALDQHLAMLARVITESNTIIISIFRSLLVFLSMPPKNKSLVSKLILFKRSSSAFCDQLAKGSTKDDFKSLDISVLDLIQEDLKEDNLKAEVKKIQTLLETLNVSVDSLYFELQCMSKCLVQNRVTLLNIFTH